ncbi:hypothetical protein BD413DRAFT_625301, partial [Trametes elegans]
YPLALPEAQRPPTVTRRQLAQRYGGSEVDTFPRLSAATAAAHGRANLMCIDLNLLWNPNALQVPGHGGLFFDTPLPGELWVRAQGALGAPYAFC